MEDPNVDRLHYHCWYTRKTNALTWYDHLAGNDDIKETFYIIMGFILAARQKTIRARCTPKLARTNDGTYP